MTGCTDLRELFAPVLDGDADDAEVERVRAHLAECADCAELFEAMRMVIGAGDFLESVDPPPQLGDEIASSPCRRWLGLLFQAVDRDISKHNLDRLLGHLDGCESCREVWLDLTLVHQVGEAMKPPNHLLQRCIRVRDAVARIAVLPRRTATAAAYILALAASLAIGNPTIIAQDLHSVASEGVSRAASSVSEVAADGRGEARVALWRAMRWGETKIDAIRGWVDRVLDDDNPDDRSGDAAGEPEPQSQGENP